MRATPSPTSLGKVLVVDDNQASRELLVELLRDEGHEVVEAENGLRALAVVQSLRPDVVLLDVEMPGIDGIETCRRIRAELQELVLPIVFVTSRDDAASRVNAKRAGGDDVITKPVIAAEIRARVQTLLQKKAVIDASNRRSEAAEAELTKAREQLVRAERLATLGTMAGAVGHELNNMSAVLRSAVAEIERCRRTGEPLDDDLLADLSVVRDHVETHARHLLGLGRPGPDFAERADFRAVVRGTLEMLRHTGRTKYVDVQALLPPDDVPIFVNRTRLEQILVNLVVNAADAVTESKRQDGTVQVTLQRHGGRALCSVVDNGIGMPPEIVARIFEPYFTTKPEGVGNGLGLPVVKQLVEGLGGALVVETEPGEGTTFRFTLPCVKEAIERPPAPSPRRPTHPTLQS